MGLLASLSNIVEDCQTQYENQKLIETAKEFFPSDHIGSPSENMLALGDNKDFMEWLIKKKDMAGKVNFIYVDPPFFSGADYMAEVRISTQKIKLQGIKTKAYKDTWQAGMEEFLTMLTSRLLLMKELLAEDGGIVVHMDWHAVHYVKIIMDEIFGEKNFVNEIIWTYKSGGVSKHSFAKKHDTLLYYSKSKNHYFNAQKEKSYNRKYKPYRFKGVKEYKDETGWYTMVNKKDVFHVDMVGRTSAERTGYATQKPEQLIELLLESCTKEGDLCADFFTGSGTLPAVAAKMGRRFIAADDSLLALAATRKRLTLEDAAFVCFEEKGYAPEENVPVQATLAYEETVSTNALCHATLRAYDCNIGSLPIEKEDRATLKKLQAADPLTLVDYWCVDKDFDGENFHSTEIYLRNQNLLMTEAEFFVKPGACVAVKVYDVFGGFGNFVAKV